MAKRKFIHWRTDMPKNNKGETFANVHILVANDGTVQDYENMAKEMQETFPLATNDEIICRKVQHSDSILGYSLASWNTYLSEADYHGWTEFKPARVDYSW